MGPLAIAATLICAGAVVILALCRAAKDGVHPLPPEEPERVGGCSRCRMNGGPEFPTCLLCGASDRCDHGVSLRAECGACDPFTNVFRIDSRRGK